MRRGVIARESRVSKVAAMTVMIALAIYFLLPVYFLVVAATKPQGDLASTFGLAFSHFHFWQNLSTLFGVDNGIFLRWALNSVIYAVGGAAVGTLISTLAGYALAKFHFRFRETFFSIVLGGVLVPTTALALPLFLLFSTVHLTDTYWAVFLPSIVSPFGVYLARIFAGGAIPDEIIESARLDGAGEFRIFFSVAFKLLSPSLVTIFLFQFVGIWNNFFLPMVMLQSDQLYPLTLGLYNWNGQISRVPLLQQSVITGSLVSIIPLIIVFLALQRFWKTGLASGSLK
ncbi:MAG: multiple sugar transport system permease protein [Actinomycetota bacterium]|jgi:multiple sugar transport system permease protein|nr:putative sugar transporter, permease component [Glaciihabitans sp.]MDQ1542845.1 multiple sugar transport system permease protein [Actinomycetota bacterium]MDQ1560670.1 multiple sugar transport system permease protein [Actinomycetota bacterium]